MNSNIRIRYTETTPLDCNISYEIKQRQLPFSDMILSVSSIALLFGLPFMFVI